MSCRTVKAVARGRERQVQVQVQVRVRVRVRVRVQGRVQVQVRVRVGVAVGARAALRDGTLMLPRSGIFSADATRLELATIAVNLSCVLGIFTDSDSDSDSDPDPDLDLDLDTARSVRRPYPRQFSHVAA